MTVPALDLPATIATIEKLALAKKPRVEQISVRDRAFLVNQETGTWSEILPRFEDVAPRPPDATVRDLASIAAWAKNARGLVDPPQLIAVAPQGTDTGPEAPIVKVGEETQFFGPPGVVLIGARDEDTQMWWPAYAPPHIKRAEVRMPFFDHYLPDAEFRSLLDFLAWVDLVRPFMDAEPAGVLDAALANITGADASKVTVAQSGATITFKAEAQKGVTTDPVPKLLRIRLPFGDPSFVTEVVFALTIKVDKGIQVRVVTLPEPATSAWIAWARDRLTAELPAGWSVLVGP